MVQRLAVSRQGGKGRNIQTLTGFAAKRQLKIPTFPPQPPKRANLPKRRFLCIPQHLVFFLSIYTSCQIPIFYVATLTNMGSSRKSLLDYSATSRTILTCVMRKLLKRSSFLSKGDLAARILDFIAYYQWQDSKIFQVDL